MKPGPFVVQKLLVIDVETTGFDPARNSCIELGAVLLDESLQIVQRFSSLIAPVPGTEISPEAMAVNRISPDELLTAPPLAAVVEKFWAEFCQDTPPPLLAGWNVWFDVEFIRHLFNQAGHKWPFRHRYLDVQSVASFHMRLAAVSQGKAITDLLGEVQQHRAYADAEHTARLLQHLARRHLSAPDRSVAAG